MEVIFLTSWIFLIFLMQAKELSKSAEKKNLGRWFDENERPQENPLGEMRFFFPIKVIRL